MGGDFAAASAEGQLAVPSVVPLVKRLRDTHFADVSRLISATHLGQLIEWLGGGPVALQRIYEKQPRDTARDFHAAVDGRGPTITVLELPAGSAFSSACDFNNLKREIIGGYNPQSWHSEGTFHLTEPDVARTGFVFNLTTGEVRRQNLARERGAGHYQTFNHPDCGPAFGGGHDLYVGKNLNEGYCYQQSYGGTNRRHPLLAGPLFYCALRQIGAMEVFSVMKTESDGRKAK
jgi:hypothetical protein